jgi:hypothetical protein
LNFSAGSAVTLKAELKLIKKTKFCRIYVMPQILLNDAIRKSGTFLLIGLYRFLFPR